MEQKTILYLPDLTWPKEKKKEHVLQMQTTFRNYTIISFVTDATVCTKIKEDIGETVEKVEPDFILAEGLSGFFIHSLAGYDRICLNPMMRPSLHSELVDADTYGPEEHLVYSFDSKKDRECHTHCFGIIGDGVERKVFSQIHYPNIIRVSGAIESFLDVVEETERVLNTIGESTWTDEQGVTFAEYGRVLLKVDYSLFRDVQEYEIPEHVRTICECAFAGTNLTRIVLPNSLHFLYSNAFAGCKLLEEVVLPPFLEFIPQNSFEGCMSLRSIKLPSGLKTIRERAFADTALQEVELPDTIQNIHPSAFDPNVRMNISHSRLVGLMQDSQKYFLYKGRKEYEECFF